MVPTTDTLTHIMVTVPTMVPTMDSMPVLPMGMDFPDIATPMWTVSTNVRLRLILNLSMLTLLSHTSLHLQPLPV